MPNDMQVADILTQKAPKASYKKRKKEFMHIKK
jgi:hypothetical protein